MSRSERSELTPTQALKAAREHKAALEARLRLRSVEALRCGPSTLMTEQPKLLDRIA